MARNVPEAPSQRHARTEREGGGLYRFGVCLVDRYAVVRAQVERVGRPKSDFDLVIACTALEQHATLVTHDAALKDGTIEGLVVEHWHELAGHSKLHTTQRYVHATGADLRDAIGRLPDD